MPVLIDYPDVVRQMTAQGLLCLYPNSGAFGFPPATHTHTVGWVGPPDPTIRPAARALARTVPAPHESTLARLATRAWRDHLTGPAWVLPKAHWAYELQFGSHTWMPGLLREVGVAPNVLEARHDGTAVGFELGLAADEASFDRLICGLLRQLLGSDFMIAWPGRPVVCTIHHHKQLWWTTTDQALVGVLQAMAEEENAE